ncbi:MAG: serine hydrolase domain-containing protein [Myxococcota bacterium]
MSCCMVLERDVEGQCENGPPLEESSSYACRDDVERYVEDGTEFDAAVFMRDGEVLARWGDYDLPMNAASVRKSVLSVLFGIAEDRGLVELDTTLADLGVGDEEQPLTEHEKQATVRDLLQARSGIYLPALGVADSWDAVMPERGEYAPGQHWYYNNWDFNALAEVFEVTTGLRVEEALDEWLAEPMGLRSYCPDHVTYQYADFTEHPMWRLYISAQDLAMIGAMMMQDGMWRGERIVSQEWIEESTRSYSDVLETRDDLPYTGYGYLWWTDAPTNTVWAVGSGGQFMVMRPETGMVVVARNNHGQSVPGRLWNRIEPDSKITHEKTYELLETAEACQ